MSATRKKPQTEIAKPAETFHVPGSIVATPPTADRAITEADLLGRPALPLKTDAKVERERQRREIAGNVMARLLGSKAACDEMKLRASERSIATTFPQEAARTAIEFADALLTELDRRERQV